MCHSRYPMLHSTSLHDCCTVMHSCKQDVCKQDVCIASDHVTGMYHSGCEDSSILWQICNWVRNALLIFPVPRQQHWQRLHFYACNIEEILQHCSRPKARVPHQKVIAWCTAMICSMCCLCKICWWNSLRVALLHHRSEL